MLSDFYRPGVALDFPKGGTQAIVAALVRGVTKHEGSHLHLNTHVSQLLIDEEARRCVGVATADGRRHREQERAGLALRMAWVRKSVPSANERPRRRAHRARLRAAHEVFGKGEVA